MMISDHRAGGFYCFSANGFEIGQFGALIVRKSLAIEDVKKVARHKRPPSRIWEHKLSLSRHRSDDYRN